MCACYYQRVALVLLASICLVLQACGTTEDTSPRQQRVVGEAMGTRWSLEVYAAISDAQLEQIKEQSIALLDTLDNKLSTYKEDSEISRFNRSTSLDWQAVSPEFAEIVQQALEISALSGGAFDITVHPLVRLWGFEGELQRAVSMPLAEQLLKARRTIGYRHLAVRTQPPALRKAIPELQINLSAIAKGYAVDRLANLLNTQGVTNHLVELGGELRASGSKANSQPWVVGIEKPVAVLSGQRAHQLVRLQEESIATSGDYRNFLEIDGVRYTHLIDPHTGMPSVYRGVSVTVIAANALGADAWATAFFVLPKEKVLQLANQHQLGVYLIERTEDDFTQTMNNKFATYLDS